MDLYSDEIKKTFVFAMIVTVFFHLNIMFSFVKFLDFGNFIIYMK